MQKKRNTIRTKVIGWFLLAATAVLLTGIISYNSYTELLGALESPASHEAKLKEIGDILADITEAEAKMRAYALARDPAQLDAYQQLVSAIKQDLEAVKLVEPISTEFNFKIDSVALLLDEQIAGVAGFIALKNTIGGINYSAKALEEINNSTDSVPALRTTTTTTTTTTTVEPLPITKETDKRPRSPKRQQKKRAQEIAKELAKLEQEPKVQTETIITTDTSFVQPDTVFTNIQQLLTDLDHEETQIQQLLANKELDLIESSMVIIDQIRGLIGGLEKQELALNIERSNNAKLIASRSTLTISIIIFVCLILGILFTYLIFKDVRISDYYNKQLIGAKNQAEQLAESKQHFLANMSHEIRTPLNAIIGFSEQLSRTTLKPKQQNYLEAVQSSSQHLLQTVNDILDYSKIEAGELKIDHVPFELSQSLHEVVTALQLDAQNKELDLTLEMLPNEPLHVLGDPFRLKQVLFNLVNNGIKFTEKGYVKVQVNSQISDSTARVSLVVRDSGIGIPKENRDEIFRDFKQVDHSITRRYEGTGLGLAICKQLVDMQRGTISVNTNLPHGSEFTVILEYELAGTITATRAHTNDVPATNALAGIRLLVADDDAFNIRLIKAILGNWGMHATYCSNGKEAMKLVKAHTYDMILTDINMPEASGVELSSFVRSLADPGLNQAPSQNSSNDGRKHELGGPEKHEIPIIALTANVMAGDLETYKKAGINDFLLKPFQEAELYQMILKHAPPKEPHANGSDSVQFKFDDFKKFSAGDKEALRPILEAFHDNLKQNLKSLEDFAQKQNSKGVAEVAHKMISSFGHVHASGPVDKLRNLENSIRANQSNLEIQAMVEDIQKQSIPILKGLEIEIEALL